MDKTTTQDKKLVKPVSEFKYLGTNGRNKVYCRIIKPLEQYMF